METIKKIDIGACDLDLYVDGQLVLTIGQVSDDKCIDLFFYPEGGELVANTDAGGTHELLVERKGEL
jgi:hypothetical protein